MSQIKFQKLIDNFSPTSLMDVLKSNDFFRIKQNPLSSFNDKQFVDFTQLGDFDLEDNTNIVVICARSVVHLNERASRKAQYDIGKKILKNFQKSRAGIFVYYDNKGDFRISLIYADYIGTKVNYSTFRRFTYFVSKEQTNITFLQQVASLDFTNFSDLKDIFSVEKVTKEFFKKYRELFIELLEYFEKNEEFQDIVVRKNISTTPDFVKKLMGQIVFLYFVQKKGWLGVRPNENWGTGDQTYLRSVFEDCKNARKNYYNDYLEPLFYKALAEKNKDDYFEPLNCKIPFLNGGLFESVYDWENTEIKIHNSIFDKLLDFFDQYNFTVDENTPSDQEISVDPEMLGKIFEELLEVKDRKDKGAFYTPREIVHYMCRESLIQHLVSDTSVPEDRIRKLFENKDTDLSVLVEDDKKAETVKKMQELKDIADKIDASLRNVKIVDPAVGSGAFPMGMLNEISSVRYYLNSNFLHKLNTENNKLSLYDIKKETLENCIYAVDLEPGAVEIAKLRFWLSLVVEYESNNSNIAPPTLPNLDYKIMQGNSLLEEYEGVKLFDEKLLKKPLISAEIFTQENELISKLQSELMSFYMKNPEWMQKGEHKNKPEEVKNLENRIRDLLKQKKKISQESVDQKDLFTSGTGDSKSIWEQIKSKHDKFFSESEREKKKDLRRQIDHLNWLLIESTLEEQKNDSALEKLKELKKSNTKPFFLWHLYFADVFEEKGGFDIVIGNPPYLKERDSKDVFESVNNSTFGRLYHQGKMDFWYYFLHKAIDIVKKDSVISYITPRYWLNSSGAKKLIKRIFYELSFANFVDIGKLKVFDNVVGQHMVAIYKKTKANDLFVYKKLENDVSDINKSEDTNNLKIKQLSNKRVFAESNEIILDSDHQALSSTIPLGNVADVSQGVVEATDKVSSKQFKKMGNVPEINIGDGVFVISKSELENIKPNTYEKSIIKKYLDPNDIFKYGLNWDNKYLIYSDGLIKNEIKSDLNFYNLKKHLDKYKKFITSSNKPYGLHRPRDSRYFTNPKIIFKGMFVENQFTYDEEGYFVGMSFSLIIQKDINYDLKYILAILNSKFANDWFYRNGKRRGAGVDIGVEKLRTFPVKISLKQEQKSFITLVDMIINITKTEDYFTNTEKQTEVRELEHKIDELVYKLYDLKPEEIEIIENSTKK